MPTAGGMIARRPYTFVIRCIASATGCASWDLSSTSGSAAAYRGKRLTEIVSAPMKTIAVAMCTTSKK